MKFFKRILGHELVSGSFYIFVGAMIANVLAFLLNLFLARNLSYLDYAVFASLLSVITLAAIPAGSINTIVVKFATMHYAKKETAKLKTLYLTFFKAILSVSISIVLIFIIFSQAFLNYLHINNFLYVVIISLIIASFYLNALNTAFLQSFLKFGFISFLSALGAILRLIFGVILVLLGYKVFGALWAMFAMTLGVFLIAFLPLLKIFRVKASDTKINLNIKEILSYAVPVFIAALFLTSFTSMDVILVKHFFDPRIAGFYAGLSLIGKVIFYFTAPIPAVMFPLLVKRHATGRNFINIFYLALILVLLPSVSITFFYFIFPDFVIRLFLGGRDYLYVAGYLGLFGIYLTIFSMVNVCVNFFLSLGKTKIAYLVIMAALAQIILIYIFHENFYQIIGASIFTSLVLLITLLTAFFKMYGNVAKIRETVAYLNTPTV